MANYANLKSDIAGVIRTNNNEEITGDILQEQLFNMVDELGAGYQYMGIAVPTTNPGSPDANVFYIASTAGTYTNFGGAVVADGEVAVLKYNGSWTKEVSGAATAAQVTQLGQDVVKELTIDKTPTFTQSKFIRPSDGRVLATSDTSFYATESTSAIPDGAKKIAVILAAPGTSYGMVAFYDENGTFISPCVAPGNDSGIAVLHMVDIPTGAKFAAYAFRTTISAEVAKAYVGYIFNDEQSNLILSALGQDVKSIGATLFSTSFANSTASLTRPLFGAPLMEVGKKYLVVLQTDAAMSFTNARFAAGGTYANYLIPPGTYSFAANTDYAYLFEPDRAGIDRLYFSGNTTAGIKVSVRIYALEDTAKLKDEVSRIERSIIATGANTVSANWVKGDLSAYGYIDAKNNRVSTTNYLYFDYPVRILTGPYLAFYTHVISVNEGTGFTTTSNWAYDHTIPAGTPFRITVRRVTENSSEDISDMTEFTNAVRIVPAIKGVNDKMVNLFDYAVRYQMTLSSYTAGALVKISYYTNASYRHLRVPVKSGQEFIIQCNGTSVAVAFLSYDGRFLSGAVNLNQRVPAFGKYIAPDDGWLIVNNDDGYTGYGTNPVCYTDDMSTAMAAFLAYRDDSGVSRLYNDFDLINEIGQASRNSLSLLWFSDVHGEEGQMRRIMEFAGMYNSYIQDILNTGDTVANQYSDGADFMDNVDGTNRILTIVGNHDSNVISGGVYNWWGATNQQTYQLLFGNVSDWGVTQPADAAQDGKCYWYKDYTTQKVRLIGIDVMSANPNEARYDASQVTWFESTLASAKTAGLSVVVCAHIAPAHTNIDCPWNNSEGYTGNPPYANLDEFKDAIDSFISSGGDFVCWLCGDTHCDEFGIVNGHSNQLVIVVATARFQEAHGIYRTYQTKSQDLFNIFAVNTTTKIIKLLRIGADIDVNMRRRIPFGYNYSTKTIVTNY